MSTEGLKAGEIELFESVFTEVFVIGDASNPVTTVQH